MIPTLMTLAASTCFNLLSLGQIVHGAQLCVEGTGRDIQLTYLQDEAVVWQESAPRSVERTTGRCVLNQEEQIVFCYEYVHYRAFAGGIVTDYLQGANPQSSDVITFGDRDYRLVPQGRL